VICRKNVGEAAPFALKRKTWATGVGSWQFNGKESLGEVKSRWSNGSDVQRLYAHNGTRVD
jgi:hypothetical protein